DGQQVTLPVVPQQINGVFYVPWEPLAQLFGIRWRIMTPQPTVPAITKAGAAVQPPKPATETLFLLQYPAAYIRDISTRVEPGTVSVVMTLSNATRVVAAQNNLDIQLSLAAARQAGVPTVHNINDYLVPRTVARSGNWKANLSVRLNYAAPVQWSTLGNPARVVVTVQRLFEQQKTNAIDGNLKLTKIRKGTPGGPVQMFVVRVDPRAGWRMRIAPGGYSVLQRARPSRVAKKHKALIAINGGFFAYDGAAVGAVLVGGEWIRLPWKGRTAIGFQPDGTAKIDNLQAHARVDFSSGLSIPIRDLNGWPDSGRVTALTRRFGDYYKLRSGEMAVEVKNGIVVGKPGGGGVHIYPDGFTLIASGGARPWLDKVQRGQRAALKIQASGWRGYTSALGGGPRLLDQGFVRVTALREAFREDVRVGRGPRTAIGIDNYGRYIILVVDGRRPFYSIGLTLTELAFTMQKLGAVDALNLDGGGSTVLAVRGKVVNRPSDGSERGVSNALLVMR
ncbi:MAG TPA: phosphodiester glycosidase family protein, partial [Abditibacteriaceae bacterium]|nr:phosphodiester glycosidase family protein [Abditibacteriaceae bacterium]